MASPAPAAAFPPWLRHAIRTALHLAVDAAAVALSYYLAYLVRFHWAWWVSRFPLAGDVESWSLYLRILYAIVPLWLGIFWYSSKLYSSPWINSADRFLKIVNGCAMGTGAAMIASYIYQRLQYSRMMMLCVFPISVMLVSVGQSLVLWIDEWMSRHESAKPVLLIGGDILAKVVTQRIKARHPEAGIYQLGELPAAAELARYMASHPVTELILLRSSVPHARILEAAEVCDAQGVAFKMLPDLLELRFGEVQLDHSLGLPAYRIQHTSLTRLNFAAKRTFDLAFSLLVFTVTALPLAAIYVLIKLDSEGPVLYKQKRFGLRGRVFEAYKFRTMVPDAEAKIAQIKKQSAQEGAFFKDKKDPRITRVGHWLRRFSLDEFPQFLNVVRGEMSVVGPRPLAITTGELEELEKDFGATAKKRMNILPGITGLWQVSGRSDLSTDQRFSLDLFYIEHWSLGMDLEIILKTVPAMIFGKGAY